MAPALMVCSIEGGAGFFFLAFCLAAPSRYRVDRGRHWRRRPSAGWLLTNRPCSSFVYASPVATNALRVSNWIVHRLYDYAVETTRGFPTFTVFQHETDPARVRTVADKNSAPLDL